MSRAHIAISVHPAHALLHVRLSGFFTLADVTHYEREYGAALARLGVAPNAHLTLCDTVHTELSTREVVDALRAVIARPDYRSRRCAMVVRGALARIQARRAVDRSDVMLFDEAAAARTWLLSSARMAA